MTSDPLGNKLPEGKRCYNCYSTANVNPASKFKKKQQQIETLCNKTIT